MKRWIKRIVFLLAAAAVIAALRVTVFRPQPMPVTVAAVEAGRVESTIVNSKAGTVKSRHRSEMSPGIAGLVAAVPVKKGQPVKKGDVLLRLDDSELRAQVNLARWSVEAAKAAAEEASVTAMQAERDRGRVEELSDGAIVSDQDVDSAQTRAEAARAAAAAAAARVSEAEAALVAAQATLDKTVMTAPFDGVVLDVDTEVGEWISPSPPGVFIPPVIDLIDPTELYVEAPIDEADAAKIALGLPARITLDAFRGQSFPGRITYISSFVETTQEQNRTLTIEAELPEGNLPPNLLPGLSADVEVILDSRDNVVRVPSYALLEGGRVLVVRGDILESVAVETGLSNWQFTEVRSGLSPGERVVVSLDRPEIQAGAQVRVAGWQQP